MKRNIFLPIVLLSSLLFLNSCSAIETVFKAGMWWAFFLVGLVVVIILVVIAKFRKK